MAALLEAAVLDQVLAHAGHRLTVPDVDLTPLEREVRGERPDGDEREQHEVAPVTRRRSTASGATSGLGISRAGAGQSHVRYRGRGRDVAR